MESGILAGLVVCVVVGILVGSAITWNLSRTQARLALEQGSAAALAQERILREQIQGKDSRVAELESDRDEKQEEIATLRAEVAAAREQAESAKREKNQVEQQLPERFAALSGRTLSAATEEFLKLAKEKLGQTQTEAKGELELQKQAIEGMLKPLEAGLEKLGQQCCELGKSDATIYDVLNRVSCETNHLSNALRRPTVRGSWGEMTLRTVMENAGLVEGQDFHVQQSAETEDGKLRPDVVIRLPRNRHLPIDSKAPLDAYREAVNCEDPAAQIEHLKRHAKLVRGHVKQLSAKAYQNQFPGVECVVMFLPNEAVYQAALEHDVNLLEDAQKARVILASPFTLVGLSYAVATILDQERMTQNAEEIQAVGRRLYDGIRTFAGHVAKLGRNLGQTVESYNATVGSMERRLLVSARQLREKGVGGDAIDEPTTVESLPAPFRSRELTAVGAAPQGANRTDGTDGTDRARAVLTLESMSDVEAELLGLEDEVALARAV